MLNQNMDTRSVTFNIIAINVLVFVACYFYPALSNYLSLHYFFNKHDYLNLLYSGSIDSTMFPNLSAFAEQASAYGERGGFLPMQIFTHMFMHANISHIFFNMFGLYMIGNILERVWGPKRYLLFYVLTGFGAVLLHVAVQAFLVYQATGSINPSMALLENNTDAWGTYFSTTVGASGALFGVLTGFAVLFPNTELYIMFIPIPVKAKYFVSVYILIELYSGFAMSGGDNVAHFAHLGGALFGFLLVKYWNKNGNSLF